MHKTGIALFNKDKSFTYFDYQPGKPGITDAFVVSFTEDSNGRLCEQSASGVPDKDGVLMAKVNPGSLAEKSGLEAGDVIRKINGTAVKNVAELLNALQVIMWQGGAQAEVLHNQQTKEVRVLLK